MRIGIFGGSFNPVHNGHLALARAAYSELNLDRVFFVPSFQTPLKKSELLLPVELRVRLLKKAIRSFRFFSINLFEVRRRRRTYTVETLRYFRRRFGKMNTLYFLCGADTSEDISRWKDFDKIVRLCHFVVMSRPGFRPRKKGSWQWLSFNALPISASDIRARLRKGKSITGLVPKETEDLLRGFYKTKKGGNHRNE